MEQDVGLHRSEEGKARNLGGLVEKLGASDFAVGASHARPAHNELYQVHLLNHVLEGANVGIRDFAALGDVAERAQVFENVVGELVLRGLEDDALKVVRVDEAVAVLVERQEGLANALALQAAQHLTELVVVHIMALLFASNV